jgi:BlaI family penicillinase repressor
VTYYETFVNLRKDRKAMHKLTQQEEEAMQLVWQNKGGFVKDILDLLPEPKIPYTTLASTLKNLEKKKYLKSVKMGNSYRFEPIIEKDEYKKYFMGSFVSDYFKNSYKDLISFFAKDEKISPAELKEILEMIEKSKS